MRARTLLNMMPSLLLLTHLPSHCANWPSWRADIAGSGKTTEADVPTEWGPEKNVVWRTPLPNRGNSTPAIWDDRVFVTQPIEAENFRGLMCFDRADGKLLWKSGVTYATPERTHNSNPCCSASPVTDGERVVVSFASAGICAYDFQGKKLWNRDLGPIDHIWGHASSPVIYKDLAIVYHGPGPGSRLVALNKKTGALAWEWKEPLWDTRDRTDGFKGREKGAVDGTWSTPIVIAANGRDELVMAFPTQVIGFDPATGKQRWCCRGLSPLIYTSPFFGDGTIVALGAYSGNSLAVRPGGEGDVTESRRLWHFVRHDGGVGSGIIRNGYLFYHTIAAETACLDIKTGNTMWRQRLRSDARQANSWSSMVLADDRIFLPNKKGDVFVFRASPKFEQIAVNSLGEDTDSSPVISGGRVFIRTHKALWCLGK
ncbi:MAG TPA: PQQ-binding-like beta-propeller repeat protein [Verrucomicrobiae bacterium]|nr:PQQ-binding-like beta-propeller repeat protein [Verrucomicrobiae bacterium]